MSRHGYVDSDDFDGDHLQQGRWRAQVTSAMRGRRGQRFLVDLIAALDALPDKRLIAGNLENGEGQVCALGALGRLRGVKVNVGPDIEDDYWEDSDWSHLGALFDIADQLAQETMYVNDEHEPQLTTVNGITGYYEDGAYHYVSGPLEHPDITRWKAVRRWAIRHLKPETLLEIAPHES